MSDTRTHYLRLINRNDGAQSRDGAWAMRDAAVILVPHLRTFLTNAGPRLDAAGLQVAVLSGGRHAPLPIVRERIHPFWRGLLAVITVGAVRDAWRTTETMPTSYTPAEVLRCLHDRYHWDRDDQAQQRYWEDVARGDLVMVWDPYWGRTSRLWSTLIHCGLAS